VQPWIPCGCGLAAVAARSSFSADVAIGGRSTAVRVAAGLATAGRAVRRVCDTSRPLRGYWIIETASGITGPAKRGA
jgi:hypothetical protein